MEIIRSDLLAGEGFSHGFTTRGGGSSEGPYVSLNLSFDTGDDPQAVASNLAALEAELDAGLPLARVAQVHGLTPVGASEAIVGWWNEPPSREADAIVSDGTPAILAVQTADCAAVLIADPQTRAVAAVHAGWRGAAGGVIRNVVRGMMHGGIPASRLLAAVGPCICQKCYEVGEDVAGKLPESADPIRRQRGKYLLDLAGAVEVSLLGAGLTSANIEILRLCTSCDDRFFSYRASGGTCGRNLGFIAAERG